MIADCAEHVAHILSALRIAEAISETHLLRKYQRTTTEGRLSTQALLRRPRAELSRQSWHIAREGGRRSGEMVSRYTPRQRVGDGCPLC